MRKDTPTMTQASRRIYVRPLVTSVVPATLVLQSSSQKPPPPVNVDRNPGEEALSKEIHFDSDLWKDEDEEE